MSTDFGRKTPPGETPRLYGKWYARGRALRRRLAPVTPLILFAVLMIGLLTGCQRESATASAKTFYTCGMHPQVVQDHPGNCPICGMKLTPIRSDESKETNRSIIAIDPATTQTMGIRTATVHRGPLRKKIRLVGTIDYNEMTLTDVTTKFKGWIEKLYVNTTGQLVMRGDPLFEIYSPELYSAQQEYLVATRQPTNTGVGTLKESASTKLKFFDVSDQQIAELEQSGQAHKTLTVHAPQDGFVVEKMAVQGQMVDAGMKTYRLADIGLVWVQAQVYEQDLVYLKLGQEATVTLDYLPDREFRGRVTYIYPSVDEKTRTAKVRMEFHNPGYFLKPGMFATVQVVSELAPSTLLVPDMAILRSGEKDTVFVEIQSGKFEAREVKLGPQAEGNNYQVLSGLKDGDRTVMSGQFMLDSESQLREAILKMGGTGERPSVAVSQRESWGAKEETNSTLHARDAQGANAPVKYICPMPEHVSIEYEAPGKCPICGMVLVPVTQATLKKLQPGGKLLYYTCPMPEHSDVHSDKPGNCPKCGMTLIPVMTLPSLQATTNQMSATGTIAPSTLYTCRMREHADVVSDKPGKCSKCEMALVPTSTVAHGKTAEDNWRQQHNQAR